MSSIGLKLISSIINSNDKDAYLNLTLKDEHFTKSELGIYTFLKEHVDKYGDTPTDDTVNEYLTATGVTLPSAKDNIQFYYDELMNRYITVSMKRHITEAKASMSDTAPKEVLGELITNFVDLSMEQNSIDIVNFKDAGVFLHDDYKKKIYDEDSNIINIGWPYIDDMSQGFQGGDVISLIGRPGQGKTYQLLFAAHHAWHKQKKNVLFVSMEMLPLPITQRLAAIHTRYGITNLKSVPMPSNGYYHVYEELGKIADAENNLWVVDGNLTATIDDIWRIARQLKPDAIYIDGAYLVQVTNKRLNKWERIGDVAENMKSKLATTLRVPVFATYQFGKEMVKKKSLEDVGLEDIYGSDVIGQVSTVVMGLFADETIESLVQKKVNLLKGRNGETGSFKTKWDFLTMDFSEVVEDTEEVELQYA